jgi:Domain of unknown function (DUF4129)
VAISDPVQSDTSARRVLLVMAASAVIAVAATGFGLLVPAADVSGVWLWAVRLLGVAVVAAGVAGLAAQRRKLETLEDRHSDPSAAAVLTAATIMAAVALMAVLAPAADPAVEALPEPDELVAAEEPGGGEGGDRPGMPTTIEGLGQGAVMEGRDQRALQPADAGSLDVGLSLDPEVLELLGDILLLVLLVAVAIVVVRMLLGRLGRAPPEPPAQPLVAAEDAEAGLEASLGEVSYDGPDPRRQITAAYHRLLLALAEAGAPRQPHEAPHEHLYRARVPLGVRPEPMHRLTELYVIAQFSEWPVTETHRAAAVDALETAQRSLRGASAAPAEGSRS